MTKNFYLIIAILLLDSCKSIKKSSLIAEGYKDTILYQIDTLPHSVVFRPNYKRVETDTTTIDLAFFDTIPETIAKTNPAEYFTYDTTKLADKKFIFLTNSADYGIVNNNGRHIYVAKNRYNDSTSSEISQDVFLGNGYKVVLIRKMIDNHDGNSYETGILEIRNSKHQITYKIHGGYKLF